MAEEKELTLEEMKAQAELDLIKEGEAFRGIRGRPGKSYILLGRIEKTSIKNKEHVRPMLYPLYAHNESQASPANLDRHIRKGWRVLKYDFEALEKEALRTRDADEAEGLEGRIRAMKSIIARSQGETIQDVIEERDALRAELEKKLKKSTKKEADSKVSDE